MHPIHLDNYVYHITIRTFLRLKRAIIKSRKYIAHLLNLNHEQHVIPHDDVIHILQCNDPDEVDRIRAFLKSRPPLPDRVTDEELLYMYMVEYMHNRWYVINEVRDINDNAHLEQLPEFHQHTDIFQTILDAETHYWALITQIYTENLHLDDAVLSDADIAVLALYKSPRSVDAMLLQHLDLLTNHPRNPREAFASNLARRHIPALQNQNIELKVHVNNLRNLIMDMPLD